MPFLAGPVFPYVLLANLVTPPISVRKGFILPRNNTAGWPWWWPYKVLPGVPRMPCPPPATTMTSDVRMSIWLRLPATLQAATNPTLGLRCDLMMPAVQGKVEATGRWLRVSVA